MDMKKFKKIGLVLSIAVIGLVLLSQGVFAQNKPILVVSPPTSTKNVGESFDLVVKVLPAGEKVCAVEGQLLVSKLVVQNIIVAGDIMPQTSPSFSNNLYFLLGVPNCTTQEKTLFTVKVKGQSVGEASAAFGEVDIIGEGKSISSDSNSGKYQIVALKMKKKAPGKESTAQKVVKPCTCGKWTSWQDKGCGGEGCLETQMLQVRTRTCVSSGCDVERQTQCMNNASCVIAAKERLKNASERTSRTGVALLLASIGSLITLGTGNVLLGIVVGLGIVLILIVILILMYRKRRGKKGD